MNAPKTNNFLTMICSVLFSTHPINALHKDCVDYFEGFSLPIAYNPNIPPHVENFTIRENIFVKEITKVGKQYKLSTIHNSRWIKLFKKNNYVLFSNIIKFWHDLGGRKKSKDIRGLTSNVFLARE